VNEGGEKPQKGTAVSRETMPLPRFEQNSAVQLVGDLGQLRRAPSQAPERRDSEICLMAEGRENLREAKTQESIDSSHSSKIKATEHELPAGATP